MPRPVGSGRGRCCGAVRSEAEATVFVLRAPFTLQLIDRHPSAPGPNLPLTVLYRSSPSRGHRRTDPCLSAHDPERARRQGAQSIQREERAYTGHMARACSARGGRWRNMDLLFGPNVSEALCCCHVSGDIQPERNGPVGCPHRPAAGVGLVLLAGWVSFWVGGVHISMCLTRRPCLDGFLCCLSPLSTV